MLDRHYQVIFDGWPPPREVAARLEWSDTKVWRIETAREVMRGQLKRLREIAAGVYTTLQVNP